MHHIRDELGGRSELDVASTAIHQIKGTSSVGAIHRVRSNKLNYVLRNSPSGLAARREP